MRRPRGVADGILLSQSHLVAHPDAQLVGQLFAEHDAVAAQLDGLVADARAHEHELVQPRRLLGHDHLHAHVLVVGP